MTVRDDIYADITEFLRNKCDVDPASVSEETSLSDELDVDSLDLIAMAQLLQNKYHVSLDDERIASTRTIGDVLTFVEEKLSNAPERL
jgi:acyl carrier protein